MKLLEQPSRCAGRSLSTWPGYWPTAAMRADLMVLLSGDVPPGPVANRALPRFGFQVSLPDGLLSHDAALASSQSTRDLLALLAGAAPDAAYHALTRTAAILSWQLLQPPRGTSLAHWG